MVLLFSCFTNKVNKSNKYLAKIYQPCHLFYSILEFFKILGWYFSFIHTLDDPSTCWMIHPHVGWFIHMLDDSSIWWSSLPLRASHALAVISLSFVTSLSRHVAQSFCSHFSSSHRHSPSRLVPLILYLMQVRRAVFLFVFIELPSRVCGDDTSVWWFSVAF